jgi:2-polyprenyl-3-methyl-5-hydroxy-6-metoxy-1,4-benzoquinol methylase
MNSDSTKSWDAEEQRMFWNVWDPRHLQEATIGGEALRRGEVTISLLERCQLSKPRILEFGCGNGWLAEKLANYGTVTGVDIADEAIHEARVRVPSATFFAGDALNMELPAEAFDAVVTLEMFSHVANQKRFVEAMANALCKGGFLILLTQNRRVYIRRADIAPAAQGQIRRWVTMGELQKLLLPCFRILHASTMQPSGTLGFLRIVNSRRLNELAMKVVPRQTIEQLKERCGLGQTLIVLAQKTA